MTSQQYAYIIAIEQANNLSDAAKKLDITLPYLSKQVQLIENELGVTILNRSLSSTQLNDTGKEVAQSARCILLQERRMKQEMVDLMDQRTGVLAIGAGSYRSTYMLPKILPDFYRKYRGTRIQLVEGPIELMEALVLEGKVDLAITVDPSENRLIHNQYLGREELVLAVPSCYPIKSNEKRKDKPFASIRLHDLGKIPFISLTEGTSLHDLTENILKKEKYEPISKLESKSLEAIYALVLEGVGAAIVPVTIIDNDVFMETPQCFSLGEDGYYRNIYAIYRADSYLSKACIDFQLLLKSSLNHC